MMISLVMEGLSLDSKNDTLLSQKEIREKYFNFRNELSLRSDILVDSLMVKTFIM